MDWSQVLGNIVSGVSVAVVVALIAWLVTDRLANQQRLARARQERNLAAAEVLYSVYGDFFAVWKEWEFVRGRAPTTKNPVSAEVRRDLLARASDYEGNYESLVVRLTLEHRLRQEDRLALWAMRHALKELRRAIRRDIPLGWWRTDDPARASRHEGALNYLAFKALTTRVAGVLVDADPRSAPPTARERDDALTEITSTFSPAGFPQRERIRSRHWRKATEFAG